MRINQFQSKLLPTITASTGQLDPVADSSASSRSKSKSRGDRRLVYSPFSNRELILSQASKEDKVRTEPEGRESQFGTIQSPDKAVFLNMDAQAAPWPSQNVKNKGNGPYQSQNERFLGTFGQMNFE